MRYITPMPRQTLLLAYRASGLSLLGIRFVTALDSPLLRLGLEGIVKAWAKKDGTRAPTQPDLI